MKKAIIMLLVLSSNVYAGELSLQITQSSMDQGDDFFNVNNFQGFQIKYQPDNSKLYYFVSREDMDIMPIYKAFTYHLTGLGLGTRVNFSKNFRLFAQAGYYIVDDTWNDRKTPAPGQNQTASEGLHYYFNRRFYGSQDTGGYYNFEGFSVEAKNTIAGTVGIELLQPISKSWAMGFVFSKRVMKIKEQYNAYISRTRQWEHSPTRDYSSTNFGVSFNYMF